MSERGNFRGGGGHRGRGGDRGGRGGRGGAASGGTDPKERPKKENIIDLNRFIDQKLKVKFNGGREVIGTLKGFDQLMNLVLDDVEELMQNEEGELAKRPLGLIVARGTLLVVISPVDGSEEISNPFANVDEDE